ncbi:MAG: hypothetical protein LBK95_14175 [Bifidobacteriaceae bacterium]|jgi:hypothetical protein|nr:hypothetical protein [Bifidobacteriaceae bacterium]
MKTKISDADATVRLENLDPTTASVRDRSATADIRAAAAMREAAQRMVDQAVRDARDAGVTWIEIGLALGVSPQGARQRYA